MEHNPEVSPVMGDITINREVSDDEVRLWRKLKEVDRRNDMRTLRLVNAGRQVGIHPERARQIGRTWTNDGLIDHGGSVDYCYITDAGKDFEFGE